MSHFPHFRVRLRCASAWVVACAFASQAAFAFELDPPQLEATVGHDDNVTRASDRPSRLADNVVTLSVMRGGELPVGEHARAVFSGFVWGDSFARYHGLSRLSARTEAQLEYRTSAAFAAPTFALFAGAQADRFQSAQRSGSQLSAGASVRQSWTDRIDAFAAFTASRRDAHDDVFDQRERSLRLHVDYATGALGTLYAGAELRRGDIVTTTWSYEDEYARAARATAVDLAFGPGWTAYRLGGRTTIYSLGWSLPLGSLHAIDIGWRQAKASARIPASPGAGAETLRYRSNLYTASWLLRF